MSNGIITNWQDLEGSGDQFEIAHQEFTRNPKPESAGLRNPG